MSRGSISSNTLDFSYLLNHKYKELYLEDSSLSGVGVFTNEDISSGEVICPLYGILYSMPEAQIDYPRYSYQISETEAIETVNEPGYINHSCEPNIYVGEGWQFIALQDIEAGSELFLDYATVDNFDYTFACQCATKNCRGKFNGLLSLDKEFQKRCGHLFSPYLKKALL